MSLYSYINFYVAQLATRYVGRYLEGIEPRKFELAWRGGNLQLSDVRIRSDVVDVLNLPVSLAYGWIGRVCVSLPLRNLLSVRGLTHPQSLLVEIKDLYVVLVPKPDAEWDEEALLRRYRFMRQRRLDQCDVKLLTEYAKQCIGESSQGVVASQSGWLARLAARIAVDVQFQITNVHIRYEHIGTDLSQSFAAGVMLHTLEINTPQKEQVTAFFKRKQRTSAFVTKDAEQEGASPTEVKEHTLFVDVNPTSTCSTQEKLFQISCIAAYWNSGKDQRFLGSLNSDREIQMAKDAMEQANQFLRDMVTSCVENNKALISTNPRASPCRTQTQRNCDPSFILKPFSCSCLLRVSTMLHHKTPCSTRAVPMTPGVAPRTTMGSSIHASFNAYQLWVELASLDLVVHKNTLRDLARVVKGVQLYNALLKSIIARKELCAPYRPATSVKSCSAMWWKYAVGCVIRRLRHSFPGAFSSTTNMWNCGELLMRARVLKWRSEYAVLLRRTLAQGHIGGGDPLDPLKHSPEDDDVLMRIQEELPEKDLLEVFVETKREYLLCSQKARSSLTRDTPSKTKDSITKSFFRGWNAWFGLRQEELVQTTPLHDNVSQRSGEPESMEDEDEFYDINDTDGDDECSQEFLDVCDDDDDNHDHHDKNDHHDNDKNNKTDLPRDLQCTSDHKCTDNDGEKEVDDVVPPKEHFTPPEAWSSPYVSLGEKATTLNKNSTFEEPNVTDMVQHLLEADQMVLDVFMELEAASMEIEMNSSVRLFGTIMDVRARVQRSERFVESVTIKDYCLGYICDSQFDEQLLARRPGLSKELLNFVFCSQYGPNKSPFLEVDIKEVIIHWTPAIVEQVTVLLSVFRSTSTESWTPLEAHAFLADTPKLISFEKLSAAKKLMCEDYRNSVICISVEAPTIIIPAVQTYGVPVYKNDAPVIVVHLGSLSIVSQDTGTTRGNAYGENSLSVLRCISFQCFAVSLREFYMEYFEKYNQQNDTRTVSGHPIISRLAVQVQVKVSDMKRGIPFASGVPFLSAKQDTLSPDGREPDHGSSRSSQRIETCGSVLMHLVEISSDLPALAIMLNRRVYHGILACVDVVMNTWSGNATSYGSRRESYFFVQPGSVDGIGHPSYEAVKKNEPVAVGFCDDSLAFNDSIHQIGVAMSCGRNHLRTLPSTKACSTEMLSVNDAALERVPFHVKASFSLLKFKMTVDCSDSLREVVTLATDRTIVSYQDLSNVKTLEFKMGQLTLSRDQEIPLSMYSYLLKTDDTPRTTEAVSVAEKASGDDQSSGFLIFIQIVSCSSQDRENPLKISVKFLRYLKLLFQPRPLRYFLMFWHSVKDVSSEPPRYEGRPEEHHAYQNAKEAPSEGISDLASQDVSEQSHDEQGVDKGEMGTGYAAQGSAELQPTEQMTYDGLNPVQWCLELSVLSVECVCIESEENVNDQRAFAICTFQNATINLMSRAYGISLFCELKNLMIEDLHTEPRCSAEGLDDMRNTNGNCWPTLFRVLPGGGSLVRITVNTLAKETPFFDGVSLTLNMEIGEVEIVCIVAKLLRFFYWIVDSFLDTFRSSSYPFAPVSTCSLSEPTSRLDFHPDTLRGLTTRPFSNPGQKLLLTWILKALRCPPVLGSAEVHYLNAMFQNKNTSRTTASMSSVQCPLTLRNYNISIRQPTLMFPVSVYDEVRRCTLTVSSITIQNKPRIHVQYGLIDDMSVTLQDVTLSSYVDKDALLTNVNLTVHFLRALLNCTPAHPTCMILDFSDIAIFLDPKKLRCLIDIIYFNLFHDGSDRRSMPLVEASRTPDPYTFSSEDKGTDVMDGTPPSQQNASKDPHQPLSTVVTSYFEFSLPKIYMFFYCNTLVSERPVSSFIVCVDSMKVHLWKNVSVLAIPLVLFCVQCQITRNSEAVTTVNVQALFIWMLYCGYVGSPFSLFLSDSHASILDAFHEKIMALRHLFATIPEDYSAKVSFLDYIMAPTVAQPGKLGLLEDVVQGNQKTDHVQCTYTSRSGVFSQLNVKVFDPRFILMQRVLVDLFALYSVFESESQHYSGNFQRNMHISQDTPAKGSFQLDIELVRSCLIAVCSTDIDSRLLAMRGHFQFQKDSVVAEATDPDHNPVSVDYNVHHDSIEVLDVELFITDLKTLTAVEFYQLQCVVNKQQASEDTSFVKIGHILGHPAEGHTRTSCDAGYSSPSLTMEDHCVSIPTKNADLFFLTRNWHDVIQLLCPKAGISLNMNRREEPSGSQGSTGLNVVAEIRPIRFELSYSDLKVLEQCFSFLCGSTGIQPTACGSCTPVSGDQAATVPATALCIVHFSVDIVEVVLVLSNDLEEYTSAPFLRLCVANGTVCGVLQGLSAQVASTCITLDVTIGLVVEFFNPRAVAYEPVIENLLFRLQRRNQVRDVECHEHFIADREEWTISLLGFKKNILCINVLDALLSVVTDNYSRWHLMRCVDLNEAHAVQSKPNAFRFAPFTLENNCGVVLIALRFRKASPEKDRRKAPSCASTSGRTLYEVVLPHSITRLSQLCTEPRESRNDTMKTLSKLTLLLGSRGECTLEKGVSIKRLGVSVFTVTQCQRLASNFQPPEALTGENDEEPAVAHAQPNYVICRVTVEEGQKQLIVESQVIFHACFSSEWGVEVGVTRSGMSAVQPITIPPLGKSALPVFRCLDASVNLKFRPVLYLQDPNIHTTRVYRYHWSEGVHLVAFFRKIRVINEEYRSNSENAFNVDTQRNSQCAPSGLPPFLPIHNFACRRHDAVEPQDDEDVGEFFHFCLSVEWHTYTYRGEQFPQLHFSFHPSFRLRSVVPLPLSFVMCTEFKVSSTITPNSPEFTRGCVTGDIVLNETVSVYSLPFLEAISLRLGFLSESNTSALMNSNAGKRTVFVCRDYPFQALALDPTDLKVWRNAWISEGSTRYSLPNDRILVPVLGAKNLFSSLLTVNAILQDVPERPATLILHWPVWVISHVSLSPSFRSSHTKAKIAITYKTDDPDSSFTSEPPGYEETVLCGNNATVCFAWNTTLTSGFVYDNPSCPPASFEDDCEHFAHVSQGALCACVGSPWCCPLDVSVRYIGLELIDPTHHQWQGGSKNMVNIEDLEAAQTCYLDFVSVGDTPCVVEVAMQINQLHVLPEFPVKQLMITYRCTLQNLTNSPLLFRQNGTTQSLRVLPDGIPVPLEWANVSRPRVFHLKPADDSFQWGGRLCPNTLSIGESFVYHLAVDPRAKLARDPSGLSVHVEKQRLEWENGACIFALVLRNDPALLQRDSLCVYNHSVFRMSLWQSQTPVTRAFYLEPQGGSVNFAWDDMLVPTSISMSLDYVECTSDVVVHAEDLSVGARHLLRFGELKHGTRFWCILKVVRRMSRTVLEVHNHSSVPETRSHLNHSLQNASVATEILKETAVVRGLRILHLVIPAVCISVISDLHLPRTDDDTYSENGVRRRSQVRKGDPLCKVNCTKYTSALLPQEFMCLYFSDMNVYYTRDPTEEFFALTMQDVQIDNCDPNSPFPVILQPLGVPASTTLKRFEAHQLTDGVTLKVDLRHHPLIDVVLIRALDLEESQKYYHIKLLRVIVLGLSIKGDMNLVTTTLQCIEDWRQCVTAWQRHKTRTARSMCEMYHNGLTSTLSLVKPRRVEHTARVYLKEFVIHPILVRVSFSTATMYSPVNSADSPYAAKSLLMRLISTIGSFQDLSVRFTALRLRGSTFSPDALWTIIQTFYVAQFWSSFPAVAGNMDFLGNPVSTLSHFGAGLGDLVAEPVRALNRQQNASMVHGELTPTVLDGLGRGAKSFWDNTVYGAFNVVSKVSGVAAQGLGVLALDEDYVKRKQQLGARRQPKDASEGLSMGAEAFGKAIVGGLKGLVSEPARAMENRGLEGLAEGVGRGVVGALVKPVAGIFEMASLAAGGIQEAAAESSGVARGRRCRRRPSRVFYGFDRVIRVYSLLESKLYDALLYTLGIPLDTLCLEAFVYDEAQNYLWVICSEELFTVIMKNEEVPKVHLHCMLWQIAECYSITQFSLPTASSSKESALHHHTSRSMHRNEARRPDGRNAYSSMQQTYSFTCGPEAFHGGVILNMQSPLPNRYIHTSSQSIALKVARDINYAILQL